MYANFKYKDINQVMYYMNIQIYSGVNFAGELFPYMNPEKLFYFLRSLVIYKDDPKNNELLMSPQTFATKKNYWGVPFMGDCDDYTIFVTAYCIYYKIPCKIVLAGRSKKAPVHIYNLVKYEGKFVPFDLTNSFFNFERDDYKYFQKIKVNE